MVNAVMDALARKVRARRVFGVAHGALNRARSMNEPELIARYFAPLAGRRGLGSPTTPPCCTPPPGCELVLTTDALVAGVHFFADDPPAAIAAKALGVNLSDLAAKGAEPLGFLLALALPPDWTERLARGFFAQGSARRRSRAAARCWAAIR